MSKKDKIIEILNLDSDSKIPTGAELNINKDKYGDLLDEMLDEALISNTFYKLVKVHMWKNISIIIIIFLNPTQSCLTHKYIVPFNTIK